MTATRAALKIFVLQMSLITAPVLLKAELPSSPTGFVTDQAETLNADDRASLETLLRELESKTSAQVAVVTVRSLEGRSVEEAAEDLYRRWGIGQKGWDNGVLFLIASVDRRVRFEVGYGLEGILPDSRVGRILDEDVIPAFSRGDVPGGVIGGARRVASLVAADAGVTLEGRDPEESQHESAEWSWFSTLVLFLFIVLVIRHPRLAIFLLLSGRGGGGGFGRGGFGGGFGGFGGGSSGGGGSSRGW